MRESRGSGDASVRRFAIEEAVRDAIARFPDALDDDERRELADELFWYVSERIDPDEFDVQGAAEDLLAAFPEVEVADAAEVPTPRILGVPVGASHPGVPRTASRLWDPRSDRIFVPRVFGIGWDLNFGALAVKLGLVKPDAEDEPFAFVPDAIMRAGLALPVLLTLMQIVFLGVFAPRLPSMLPVHFSLDGTPDRWGSFWEAFALPLVFSVGSTAYAIRSFQLRREPIGLAVSTAFASLFTVLGLGITLSVLLSVSPVQMGGRVVLFATLGASVVVPLMYLVSLSWIGERHERAASLDHKEDAC